ncbi:MAG: hypothetical protein MZV63_46570 [Marinilabiliales bacterium]|nr:hypothetical protein [Marinilabiliales bacterium]
MKAAATAGKKQHENRKGRTLRNILNQEYGWFKSDSAAKAKPAEKKPRFQISWEETDSCKKQYSSACEEKKEDRFRIIFKKK